MKSRTGSKNLLPDDDCENKTPAPDDHDTSALYIRDRETGDWKVRNPAGSIAYNYLYREDMDMD